MSRTSKSVVNTFFGVGCSLCSNLLSFVLNAIFIRLLGLEYAGINSLFASILNILNVCELGVSNAILFRLYKFIACGETERVEQYLSYYRKICILIGGVIALLGACCIPFLQFFIKEQPAFPESLWSLFLIVLSTSVFQHLYDYRSILIIAKQERFIVTAVNYSTLFICHGLQILSLLLFKDIYLYLGIKLGTTILNGIICGIISKKRYKSGWHCRQDVSKEETQDMLQDVGCLVTYKFCRTLDSTLDTFIISKFIAIATTAIYSSVNIIFGALKELLGQINDSMIASIGDLNASGKKEAVKSVFYETLHMTFLVYGVCVITLAPILNPFTSWWIGYELPIRCVYVMLANFIMYGFGMHVAAFRNSLGLFKIGWLRPAFTSVLNLVLSLVLVVRYGLIGTLLGTLLSGLLTLSWYDPYIVSRYGWGGKPYKYYCRYFTYAFIITIGSVLIILLSNLFHTPESFISILWQGSLYFFLSTIYLVIIGSFFSEQKILFRRLCFVMKGMITCR